MGTIEMYAIKVVMMMSVCSKGSTMGWIAPAWGDTAAEDERRRVPSVHHNCLTRLL